MKRVLKGTVWGLIGAIVLLAGLALAQKDKLTRLMAVNSLFAPDKIVSNFIAMETLFEHTEMVPQTEAVNQLQVGRADANARAVLTVM